MIGLFFFIRASVKDRTEQVTLNFQMPEDDLLTRLQTYFENELIKSPLVNLKINKLL